MQCYNDLIPIPTLDYTHLTRVMNDESRRDAMHRAYDSFIEKKTKIVGSEKDKKVGNNKRQEQNKNRITCG